VRRVSGALLTVADVSRCVSFYTDVLGFRVVSRCEGGSADEGSAGDTSAGFSTSFEVAGPDAPFVFGRSEVTLRSPDGDSTLGLVAIEPDLVDLVRQSRLRTLRVPDLERVRSSALACGAPVSDEGDALTVTDPDGRKWRIVTAIDCA
jgi:catechol 2,3-dioxygenase-like lactoylglutathione lyase family enzyme